MLALDAQQDGGARSFFDALRMRFQSLMIQKCDRRSDAEMVELNGHVDDLLTVNSSVSTV
jgi:hypothetical protein